MFRGICLITGNEGRAPDRVCRASDRPRGPPALSGPRGLFPNSGPYLSILGSTSRKTLG